jgi:phospholipid/cholesterol/gamma-HCH transport system permease protein
MRALLVSVGDFGIFSAAVLRRVASRRTFVHRGGFHDLVAQMHRVGVESLTVVNLCALFIGFVLVLQTAYLLSKFAAQGEVGMIVSAAFVREIGPVFAAIMFAGRVGTGIAAEIGSMVVTEQVDAYQAFGVDPLRRLAAPRVLATALMLPALTAIAVLVGIFAGYLLAITELDMSGAVYLEKSKQALEQIDLVESLIKSAVFGLLIGLVATYCGFRTARATEEVGASTTRSMVASVLGVLIADFVLTKFFLTIADVT